MADCLFCAIAAGDIPSTRLYEDERVLAFLDINPLRVGHALVIPKAHGAKLAELDPADQAALLPAATRLATALAEMTGDPDALFAIHDGPSAGQEVAHVHVHIVPREPGDGGGPIHALFPDRPTVSESDREVLAAQVRDRLGVHD